MTTRRRLLLSPLLLLVALAAILTAGTVSASAGHGPQTRVRAIPTAMADAVGQQSSETAGSVGCLRPSQPGLASGSCVATEAASESGLVDFAEENTPHTFGERAGHIADTPANRAVIQDAISPETYIRTTPQGVNVYQKLLPDGTQSWAEVFNGKITNGGVNDVPRGG